jgi:hypothetical protein
LENTKENKDKRIIKFKSQNHKHVFNKSKLKAGKRKMILHRIYISLKDETIPKITILK